MSYNPVPSLDNGNATFNNNVNVSGVSTFNAGVKTKLNSEVDGVTITFDMNESNTHSVRLGGNRTLAVSNVDAGQKFTLRLEQDSTGNREVTWWNNIDWIISGSGQPILNSGVGAVDYFGFLCTSGGYYDGFHMTELVAGGGGGGGGGGFSLPAGGLENQILYKISDGSDELGWIDNYATEFRELIKNDTGSDILKGTAVMATGAVGDRIRVAPSVADGSVEARYMFGIASEDISDSSEGYVTLVGPLKDIVTSGYPIGTVLWLDPDNPGGLTSTQPTSPNLQMSVAIVTNTHATNGRIFVRMWEQQPGLHELHDVNVDFGLASGDLIAYDSSNLTWVNIQNPSGNLQAQITENANDIITVSGLTGGGSYTTGSGLTLVGTEFNVYGGSGNFEYLEIQTDNTTIPKIKFTGSGVTDTPISLEVASSFESATGSGSALLFQGKQGQLFSITDNLSSGTIFSVSDITGLPMLEIDASGHVQIGEFADDITLHQAVLLSGGVPSSTTNKLYNDGGTLKFDGSTVVVGDVTTTEIAASTLVTETEGISSNDNDTTIPTSAAVKDYVDNNAGGGTVQGTDGTYDIQPTSEGATAGNARGEGSVDLQTHRSAATQVASGGCSVIGGGCRNTASSGFSTISGGRVNTASGSDSTIGGGYGNTASGYTSSVLGGRNGCASNTYSTVSGGYRNWALGSYSIVVAGNGNTANNTHSIVVGGNGNTASGACSFVAGGATNCACATSSTVGGGVSNTASGGTSTISGGYGNTASGAYSTVSGGYCNITNARHSIIAGGHRNIIQSPTNECCSRGVTIGGGVGHNSSGGTLDATTGDLTDTITCCDAGAFSTIAGGLRNIATGSGSALGGGSSNIASSNYTTVAGGLTNTASGQYSTVSGGYNNTASGSFAVVAGRANTSSGTCSVVSGGSGNVACGSTAAVAGGTGNNSSGTGAFVGAGFGNTASGSRSTVGGGVQNTASGQGSTIAGGGWISNGNTASGTSSSIGGGDANTASGNWSTVSGGVSNTASGYLSAVGGGVCNTASATNSSVAGGCCNITNARHSIIAGGHRNIIQSPTNECCSRGVTIGGGIGHNSSGGTLDGTTGDLTGTITCCDAGVYSTISGGLRNIGTGACSSIGGGCGNTVSGEMSTVSGGCGNTASSCGSTISGGCGNTATSFYSTVSGGYCNIASGFSSIIGGGVGNTASGNRSTVSGGRCNTASGYNSTVGGGYNNTASSLVTGNTVSGGTSNTASGFTNATVGGGGGNIASSAYSTIAGGQDNTASGNCSTVGGGVVNTASGRAASVGGGYCNTASGCYSTVAGGCCNITNARHSIVAGGHRNIIQSPTNECCSRGVTIGGGVGHNSSGGTLDANTGDLTGTITCCDAGRFSTIAGGLRNCATGACSTVAGGCGNTATSFYSTVAGGCGNTASGQYSTAAGGLNNNASALWSTVGGGSSNTASSYYSTVSGGSGNAASAFYSTVSGGDSNTASGSRSTVGGGDDNIASGSYSTVAGGRSNTSSGTSSAIVGGRLNTASAGYSTVGGGYSNKACSTGSTVAGGQNNIACGSNSTVIGGVLAKATKYGEVSHAAGYFGAHGDAQHTVLVARDSTTDATANQVLFIDGSFQRLTIPAETTWMFTIKLAAHNDTDNDGGWWFFRGGIRRDAANNTSLIGTVSEESSKDSNISSATASVVADDTNEALEIRVTGVASKNIRWVAVVDISQVSWGTP